MSWAECLNRFEPIKQVNSDLRPATDSVRSALYSLYYHTTGLQVDKTLVRYSDYCFLFAFVYVRIETSFIDNDGCGYKSAQDVGHAAFSELLQGKLISAPTNLYDLDVFGSADHARRLHERRGLPSLPAHLPQRQCQGTRMHVELQPDG